MRTIGKTRGLARLADTDGFFRMVALDQRPPMFEAIAQAKKITRDQVTYADVAAGVRKQATLPAGATSLGLAGTAPGVVLEVDGSVVVALPGPPGELQRLWARALETEPVGRLLSRARPPG